MIEIAFYLHTKEGDTMDPGRSNLSSGNVFITGATGFIGRATVVALHEANYTVTALLRSPQKKSLIEPFVDDVIAGNLNNEQALSKGIHNADSVIHLACALHRPWDHQLHAINIDGALKVAQACAESRQQPHLVLVSSLAARGPSGGDGPISAYGRAKAAAERAVLETYDPEKVSIVRPPMVIGPKDPTTRRVFKMIHRGILPKFINTNPYFSLVDVRDLSDGLMRLVQHGPIPVEPLYFAYEDHVSLKDLAHHITGTRQHNCRIVPVPRALLYLSAAVTELYARGFNTNTAFNLDKYRELTNGPWCCDPSRVQMHLNWYPAATLTQRLTEVYESYHFDSNHQGGG